MHPPYLWAATPHQVLRNGVDLILHLNLLLPVARYSYQQNAEVGPTQVQCQEVSIFWWKLEWVRENIGLEHFVWFMAKHLHYEFSIWFVCECP